MTKTVATREHAADSILPGAELPLTPLAEALACRGSGTALLAMRGVRTPALYSDAAAELSALVGGASVYDHGARVRLRITGDDRVRWLNGMVTNAVKTLRAGSHNYTFVLNAQGRIQGDATVFAFPDQLVFETDRSQAERLRGHLDRFIIMDDVELEWEAGRSTLGLAGPGAGQVLAGAGLPVPQPGSFLDAGGMDAGGLVVVGEEGQLGPRYSIWTAAAGIEGLWEKLLAEGAVAAGARAVESLRVLEGTPLFGVDITEKTLAQETGQMRALNFNKGCYLGQEIVERIRSRATVHRGVRQFSLTGEPAAPGAAITGNGQAVGEITSIAPVGLPGWTGETALGVVRIEALDRGDALQYAGGQARLLDRSPLAVTAGGDV